MHIFKRKIEEYLRYYVCPSEILNLIFSMILCMIFVDSQSSGDLSIVEDTTEDEKVISVEE